MPEPTKKEIFIRDLNMIYKKLQDHLKSLDPNGMLTHSHGKVLGFASEIIARALEEDKKLRWALMKCLQEKEKETK